MATVIIFLALVRCIVEPFRLQHYSPKSLTFGTIEPYLIGSLISALGLLAMTILFYFGRYRIIIVISILTIAILFVVRGIYLLP
jgi:hypothetical protein